MSKKLKENVKEDIVAHVIKEYKSSYNKDTDGMILAYYVISLIENCHRYDDWFEKE